MWLWITHDVADEIVKFRYSHIIGKNVLRKRGSSAIAMIWYYDDTEIEIF